MKGENLKMLKRSKISLMAFISVSCVLIILISLYPNFFVLAWSDFNMIEILDIQDTYITASDLGDGSYTYFVPDTTHEQDYHNIYQQGFNYHANDAVANQLNQLDFSKYVASFKSDYSSLYLFYLPENSFVVQNKNNALIYAEVQYSDVGAGYNSGFPVYYTSTGAQGSVMWQSVSYGTIIDGVSYSVITLGDSDGTANHICSLNIPVYYYDDYNFTFDSLEDLEELNNPIIDTGSDSSVFPDGSGGSPANNLYLESPDFHFSNKNYTPPYSSVINSGDSVPNGSISFNCLLNDYQTSNASNFSLEFSYKLIYNVDYKNHLNNDIGPFKQTSSLLNNKKNLSIPFVSGETSVALTDFINDNNTYTISFADVFSQLNYDSYNLTGLLAQSREVTSIDYKKFDLYCNVRLVSQGAKSNLYSEWYNPITKKGFLVSDAITDNNNPFVVNPNDQADSNPDSTNISPESGLNGGSDSSSNSNASNNVVINNNPTINNNNSNVNSNDNSTPWLIDHLFGPNTVSNGAIGDNKISDLTDTTGANNWIEVMKQSFSFVPVGFFNQLQLFFGICLGILVVALILRIILDLL